MYVRYTQPPGDLFDWYEEYLQDEEEVDVKAGGGQVSSRTHKFGLKSRKISYHPYNFLFVPFLVDHHRTNALPTPHQVGLVFHTVSPNPCAHPKANRDKAIGLLSRLQREFGRPGHYNRGASTTRRRQQGLSA